MTGKQKARTYRSGSAVVELAMCLPLLVTVVFGSIELSDGIYLQQSGTAAAYEAARVVTSNGGTEVSAQTRASEILTSLNITGASVTIFPTVDAATARSMVVSVQVSIPSSQNSSGVNFFLNSRDMVANVTMVRQ